MPTSRNNRKSKASRNNQKLYQRKLEQHRVEKTIAKRKEEAQKEIQKLIEERKAALAERKAEVDTAIAEVQPLIDAKIATEESVEPVPVKKTRKRKVAETVE